MVQELSKYQKQYGNNMDAAPFIYHFASRVHGGRAILLLVSAGSLYCNSYTEIPIFLVQLVVGYNTVIYVSVCVYVS